MGAACSFTGAVIVTVVAASVLAAGCGHVGFDEGEVGADLGFDAARDLGVDASADASADGQRDAAPTLDAGRCPGPSTFPACERLRAIPEVPVIDGIVECGLALEPFVPQGWTVVEPIPTGHRAELVVAWHPDGVYFFVHVITPTVRPPWSFSQEFCGDGVEVYLDADGVFAAPPAYDAPGTRQLVIPAPSGASSSHAVGYVDGRARAAWDAGRVIAVRTVDGYAVEAFVRRDDVFLTSGLLASGDLVGIDVAVNVAGAVDRFTLCGRRLGQYFLHAANATTPPAAPCDGLPYCDVGSFCAPTLLPPGS